MKKVYEYLRTKLGVDSLESKVAREQITSRNDIRELRFDLIAFSSDKEVFVEIAKAMLDYFELDYFYEMEVDPMYPMPQPQMRRVLKLKSVSKSPTRSPKSKPVILGTKKR